MGKKAKNRKKGTGAEKTALKTDKKLSNKMKKQLEKLGEEDIESIVAQIEKEERKKQEVSETVVEPPSRRLNFTFIAHPDKEQLILFGGEYFNGQKTFLYNDLFFYNIPTHTWSVVKTPGAPPPRCGHQMVATAANKGQLWLFGGEFASPTQSQFYHYRDLWVYHMAKRQWEKIQAPNGPSARSGHRMVYSKKNLIVFGGFHDNLRDYKYFNDVHMFNTETYAWTKVEIVGSAPAPRSACCMTALNDGRVLVYGGYSKERIKKDVDKGKVFTDAYLLTPDKNDTTGLKWKWSQIKLGNGHFSPRCSMPMTSTPNNATAYAFGGVFDTEDDEEDLSGTFFNDFLALDLERLAWQPTNVGRKELQKAKATARSSEEPDEQMQTVEESVTSTTISDDGVFKVVIGPASTSKSKAVGDSNVNEDQVQILQPSPRINAGLAVKHGTLYLYGGMYEDGDKQVTYNDFYAIDLKKMNEWKVLQKDDTAKAEWLGSESESEGDDDEAESGEDSEDSEEGEQDDEEMDTD